MRRIAAAILVIAAIVAVLASGSAAGGDDGSYRVRAMFDNSAFLVTGEEVRIAGANVGQVADVEVTMGDEPVHEDGSPGSRQGGDRAARSTIPASRTSARTRPA